MITNVSEITEIHVANYIKLEDASEKELSEIKTFLNIAKNFIKNYTGVQNLDLYDDFIIVVYILCQDMYDNRTYYVDKSNLNKVVDTILGLHSINLIK